MEEFPATRGVRALTDTSAPPRVLAIASGGGHWEQLMALSDAFAATEVVYATTLPGLTGPGGETVHVVPDCNRNEKWKALRSGVALLILILRKRPNVIVTTGALPGFLAIAIGRRLGARTMWIDSIANAEEMSMAGRLARSQADRWLSQWPSVAEAAGAEYAGSVL